MLLFLFISPSGAYNLLIIAPCWLSYLHGLFRPNLYFIYSYPMFPYHSLTVSLMVRHIIVWSLFLFPIPHCDERTKTKTSIGWKVLNYLTHAEGLKNKEPSGGRWQQSTDAKRSHVITNNQQNYKNNKIQFETHSTRLIHITRYKQII